MDSYIEISLKPDAEMPLNWLLNAIYTKLHKALVDARSRDLGVSFPKAKVTLGNVLRLHGKATALERFSSLDWLGGMAGYCTFSPIQPVPDTAQYRTVRRKQSTMTQSKLNRLIKRGSISQEQVKEYRAIIFTKGLDNPYIELKSATNGHSYRRYIEFGPLLDHPVEGDFDKFGLSKTATIPWF
ncbi:type I-F CRISPR-associated endoribonuclease Cas6/Csy4 [Neptuniibacter sp. 1_MG-2023]|jgi:CRISPR-associated endonuclease Csy4|uniref:type I-F CRISPR-associated endoribonuclease Cas6/Csy4 n=1 Tax=Neptuniibacter sp. 1_MG-2023 TaxID=3062662 RepID=UPI0026E495B2|nr:type I-F CRISPR-associated endoribonuclease Cas6/Csy4 [Neptuniibacter sp. 1_MG-2023]MDO6592339.1 type I-F CRISPR-associated endoribonuclease Cas6/Csy4 [Neptuniibacter sp. 1_MG-2023]